MSAALQLAITADLHWGHGGRGEEATRLLASFLHTHPPDLLILAGDIGTGSLFEECLRLFADLPCRKALVPGNHDLWVRPEERRNSLRLLRGRSRRDVPEARLSLPRSRTAAVARIRIWLLSAPSTGTIIRGHWKHCGAIFPARSIVFQQAFHAAVGTTMLISSAGRWTMSVSRLAWWKRLHSICKQHWSR